MGYRTALDAALAGEGINADTVVLASATSGSHAGIILTAPHWGMPDLVHCYRDDDGWHEGSSTSGLTFWELYEEPDLGVLIRWGRARPGEIALRITFRGITSDVPITNGHYAWITEHVRKSEIDDQAEFVSLPESCDTEP